MIGSEALEFWKNKKPVYYGNKQVYILKFNCRICPIRALIASQYSWQAPNKWVEVRELSQSKE